MNKKFLFGLFATLLLLVGCDYNEDNFPGFDDYTVTQVAVYEGDYTGKYPSEGYFTSKNAVEDAVSDMLEEMYPYCDKGSSAKVKVNFGEITVDFAAAKADVSYTLAKEDYDAMGEESGQPGKYNNFDSKMDIDAYLTAFLAAKYADLADGKIVKLTYKFYAGSTSDVDVYYQKDSKGWAQFSSFTPDMQYELTDEDYDAMGTESGTPGRYNNFDSNMDVTFYIGTFLKLKFPYTAEGTTCEVTYKYYANKNTTNEKITFKYDGTTWTSYDPFAEKLTVATKIAEMKYDGTAWTLSRLVGGTMKIAFTQEDYQALLDWSLANKPEYKSTKYDTEEYYFGVSTYYPNINNQYSTWKSYYNVGGVYDGLSDEEIQGIMDARLAWGIGEIVLPMHVSNPDPGLSYLVSYEVYGGRGSGNYAMGFMYNTELGKFEMTAAPIAQ